MVGARLFASAPAWLSGRTPSSNSKPAAGTATRASGHPQGRTTAQASVATRSRPASVSAMGLGTVRESLVGEDLSGGCAVAGLRVILTAKAGEASVGAG